MRNLTYIIRAQLSELKGGFMGVLLPAILLVLCGVTTLAAQGASPGAPLGTREAQAAIRAGRNTSLEPTPRLADGTPNLGRVGTEKGIWGLPGNDQWFIVVRPFRGSLGR